MAENFIKTLKDGWKNTTGAEVQGSDLGTIIGAENNAGRELKYNGVTLDKRLYDTRNRLLMMKDPGYYLEKRLENEDAVKKEIQEIFLTNKAKYLKAPHFMSSKDAEERAMSAVQQLFTIKMQDLDSEYKGASLAEEYYKHKDGTIPVKASLTDKKKDVVADPPLPVNAE